MCLIELEKDELLKEVRSQKLNVLGELKERKQKEKEEKAKKEKTKEVKKVMLTVW